MAKSNQIMSETIKNLFRVNLLVASTENAQSLCKSLLGGPITGLLKRFNTLKSLQVPFRDPSSNQQHQITELRFKFEDINDLDSKPNQATIKKILYDSVSAFSNCPDLEDPNSYSTPWFDKWKETFFNTFEVCDHEFVTANFGCIFVLSSQDAENFKDVLTALQSSAKSAPNVRWFWPNFCKYFLVLNEVAEDENRNDENTTDGVVTNNPFFSELVAYYGAGQCYWLDVARNHIDAVYKENETALHDVTDNVNNSYLEHPLRIEDDALGLLTENHLDKSVPTKREVIAIPSDKLLGQMDSALRFFVYKGLIPWTERQMRVLNEAISLRKGLRRSIFSATKSFFVMSSSSVNFRTNNNQSVVYSSEANEMQQRKFADVAMCLTLYEVAYGFYYSARKEFQSEGAWLYYAGASECCALASFLVNKFQKHYFDQAISCYLETCKTINLAARATLLAADVLRHNWPNEASSLFIRMTSEESDLRSALFLEQAAKCFMEGSTLRRRKAAFHYVLSGHRYNRCGLKRHALCCYSRYTSPHWSCAIDHVNYTLAKLYLQISNITVEELGKRLYKNKGLEILRLNADKETFFADFVREIKKDAESEEVKEQFNVKIPVVKAVFKEVAEGSVSRNKRLTCFVNEPIYFYLTLSNSFRIELSELGLICNQEDVECRRIAISLEPIDDQTVPCEIIPKSQCDFDLLGIQFEASNISFASSFSEKLQNSLKFRSLIGLPPIDVGIKISSYVEGTDAVELYTGEIVDLIICLKMKNEVEWTPNKVMLTTNVDILSDSEPNKYMEKPIPLVFKERNCFRFQAPSVAKAYSLFFKIDYYDNETGKNRVFTKTVELYVRECLNIDGLVENVVSLKNVLSHASILVYGQGEDFHDLQPGLTAHMLTNSVHIAWKSGTRNGFVSLPSVTSLR